MSDLLKVLSVSLLALAIVAGAVFYGDDTTVTVPPPEVVAEEFTRQVAARRYDRALTYVDRHSGITLVTVRLGGEALHRRAGAIDRVEGEPGRIDATRQATATAVLTTQRDGRVRYAFRFARVDGVWKITVWEQIP